MICTLSPYWATIRTGEGSTADRRFLARSDWAAWWLAQRLYPEVIQVRRAR
jgi:hypothetical protein